MRIVSYTLAAACLLFSLSLLGACTAGEGCACGSNSEDPIAEHDLSFDGTHTVDDECLCSCGNDAPYGLPLIQECSEYEQACSDSRGNPDFLVCE